MTTRRCLVRVASACKLVSVLCLIPAFCSWAFLEFHASFSKDSLVMVRSMDESWSSLNGLYLSTTAFGTFVPIVSDNGLPSVDLYDLAASLQGIRIPNQLADSPRLTFFQNRWCLSRHSADKALACSPDLVGEYHTADEKTVFTVTPWRTRHNAATSDKDATTPPTWWSWWWTSSSSSADDSASFRRNPNKTASIMNHSHFADLLQHPATYMLVALQLVLAIVYWNSGTEPMTVAKYYPNMVQEPFEIWRSLTGATAHFEAWHLAVNLMSLFSLGQELEGQVYSSLGFLSTNLVLIPITTAFWMGLHWLLQQRRQDRGGQQTQVYSPTVGYSGVLFAWMVVASLRQTQTCPLFFLPSLCFSTYRIFGLKWSWSPLVQLIVMQVLLPRVSWTGHAAGLVAGFLVTYGILPASIMEQPAVTLPLLYAAYLVSIRKAIVIPSTLVAWKSTISSTSLLLLFLTLPALAMTFGVRHSMTTGCGVVLFVVLLQPRQGHVEAVVRARVLTVVLCLVSNGMTAGALIFGQPQLRCCFLWILSSALLFWILVGTASELPNTNSGIFGYTIGWTVPLAKDLARRESSRHDHYGEEEVTDDGRLLLGDIEGAFPGRGQRLGGS